MHGSPLRRLWKKTSKISAVTLAIIVRPEPASTDTKLNNIDAQFAKAQADVKELPVRPGNLTLLRLYALFKQGSVGDAGVDEKPGFADIVRKYKYDAWAALTGTAQDTAKQQYVELVESLKNGESA
jgi:acyl-CoA-binding protein